MMDDPEPSLGTAHIVGRDEVGRGYGSCGTRSLSLPQRQCIRAPRIRSPKLADRTTSSFALARRCKKDQGRKVFLPTVIDTRCAAVGVLESGKNKLLPLPLPIDSEVVCRTPGPS